MRLGFVADGNRERFKRVIGRVGQSNATVEALSALAHRYPMLVWSGDCSWCDVNTNTDVDALRTCTHVLIRDEVARSSMASWDAEADSIAPTFVNWIWQGRVP